jgi:hypothetical protein
MENTTLILGAGASLSYGYPLGRDLIKLIVSLHSDRYSYIKTSYLTPESYNSDGLSNQILALMPQFSKSELNEFIRSIDRSLNKTIDLFIEKCSNEDYKNLTKHLVAQAILLCEQRSKEIFDYPNGLKDHWYETFFGNPKLNSTTISNINVITFNYDRSLEYAYALSLVNGGSLEKASENVKTEFNKLRIYHIHGKVLFPKVKDNWASILNYGKFTHSKNDNNLKLLSSTVNNMITCFEKIKYSTENLEYCPTALSYIEKTSRVYYMGFGFSPENLSRIPFDIRNKIVKATAIQLSNFDQSQIKSQINEFNFQKYGNSYPTMDFEFHDINCDQMIKNHLIF